jgi:hypothetical protein
MTTFADAVRRSRIAADDSGVTLIELVMASAILFIAAIGVITALGFAATSSQQSTMRARALNLANERLEKARDIPYDNVGVVYEDGTYGDPAGNIPAVEVVGDFLVETQVDWSVDATSGRAEYKNMRIAISWQNPRSGTLSIASAIYGSSALTNNGDLKVIVRELGTNVPIDMAQVWVTPAGSTLQRHRWTGADGSAFYGMLPIGSAQVAVAASGWVFDTITPASVVADQLTLKEVYGYRPVTVVVHVTETSGTPVPYASVRLQDSKLRYFYGTTGGDGVATITGLIPDNYGITVTATGRASAAGSIAAVTSGGTFTTTITMSAPVPPGSLRVRVKNSTGTAITGATVSAVGPSPDTTPVAGSGAVTPSSGEVFFASVVGGTYTVNVTASGYNNYTDAAVVVVSGIEKIVDVTMVTVTPPSLLGTLMVQVWTHDGAGHPDTSRKVTLKFWQSGSWQSVNNGGSDHWHTNSAGQVTFADLAPGTYRLTVDGSSQDVAVTGGATAYAVFQTSGG